MKTSSISQLTAIFVALATLIAVPACAGSKGGNTSLADNFEKAINSRGSDYLQAREPIIKAGDEALAFLNARAKSDDWRSQLLAKAMIERIRDPRRFRHYDQLLYGELALVRWMSCAGPMTWLIPLAMSRPGDASNKAIPANPLQSAKAGPYLAEVLLTGTAGPGFTVNKLPKADFNKLYTFEEIGRILGIPAETAGLWFGEKADASGRLRHGDISSLAANENWLQDLRSPQLPQNAPQQPVKPNYYLMSFAAIRLGAIKYSPAAPALAFLMQSKEECAPSISAALGLGVMGDPHYFGLLVSMINPEGRGPKDACVKALGLMGDPRAVEPLAALLNPTDYGIYQAAADALVMIKHPSATKALLNILESRHDYARRKIFEALKKKKDPLSVQPLIEYFSKDQWRRDMTNAAEVLAEIGDRRAVQPFISALGSTCSPKRLAAIRSLGKLKDPAAVEPLLALLSDRDETIVIASAEALAQIGDLRAKAPLRAIHDKDPRPAVRSAAIKACVELTRINAKQPANR